MAESSSALGQPPSAGNRETLLAIAREEIEWFYGTMEGRIPRGGSMRERRAATAIDRWLDAILTFHRGALRLRYTPAEWPRELTARYGPWTSLVVRLECALYPSDGRSSTEELERAGATRLLDSLLTRERGAIVASLPRRAKGHVRVALLAYVKARGRVPSVLLAEPCASGEDAAQ
jgi:hypothetical protein